MEASADFKAPMRSVFPNGIYIHMLPFFLLGYAVGGRAFAYLGVPPLYMGEILLFLGLFQMLCSLNGASVFLQSQLWFLAAFMFWSMMQTVPYISEYGMFAMRDAVLWGYGMFAFIIAIILTARPLFLELLIERYQFFARIFPFIAVLGLVLLVFFKRVFFDVSEFIQMKPGDIFVQLAGIITFALCGLMERRPPLWVVAILGAVVIAGSVGRGGLLAFCFSLSVIVLLRLRYTHTWKIVFSFCSIMAILTMVLLCSPHAKETQNRFVRKISPEQLVKNMMSIVVPAEEWGLEGTKRYRMDWWNKIIDYTFFGQYFVNGKGYGINLAISDDQVLNGDISLRNPHNAHLTILARSGVPGLALWIVLNFSWVLGIIHCIIKAKLTQMRKWEGWFCTLLAFYLAVMVNASFDVYLEGPMGGVWFWTVFGIGVASMHLYHQFPDMMAEYADPDRP